jgi:hypothetical protein
VTFFFLTVVHEKTSRTRATRCRRHRVVVSFMTSLFASTSERSTTT